MVSEKRKDDIRKRIEELNMQYLGDIPFDEKLSDAIFNGQSLLDLEDYAAKSMIHHILDTIGG